MSHDVHGWLFWRIPSLQGPSKHTESTSRGEGAALRNDSAYSTALQTEDPAGCRTTSTTVLHSHSRKVVEMKYII